MALSFGEYAESAKGLNSQNAAPWVKKENCGLKLRGQWGICTFPISCRHVWERCIRDFFFTHGAAFWLFKPFADSAYSPKLRTIFLWHHLGGSRYQFRRSDYDESKLSVDVNVCRDFNFAKSFQAKRVLKGSFTCHIIIWHACLRFSHPENLPTQPGIEPATLGVRGGHVISAGMQH